MLTMTAVFNPIRNSEWSLVIKTLPIDCLRGSLENISGKGSIPRGEFMAQYPPK